MGRFKWLFLLCLVLTLGFVWFSGSYLHKNMTKSKVNLGSYQETRTSEMSEKNSHVKRSEVLAEVQRTTKPPQTVNITHNVKILTKIQIVAEVKDNRTDLEVGTRRNRTEATPKPADTGTPAPPTVPPDKRSPTWFLRDDTYTRSKCPSAIRKNPDKVPGGQNFIPDIPVLMWSEHITPEEYARLTQFKMSYGWDGMSYEDVKNCLRHLNTSAHRYMFPGWAPDHAGCIRCAVVGNGGILRGSGKGREIDGHDFVWRVNAAITEGFEEDVGKRTSFYFHSVNSMKKSAAHAGLSGFRDRLPPQSKDTVYTSISHGRRDYVYFDAAINWKPVKSGRDRSKAHEPPSEYGVKPASTKFRMLHPDFMRYLKYHWLNSSRGYGRFEGIYQPSKGAMMLLAALHTCDVTDAYGFLTADHAQYSDHYYEKDWQKFVFYVNHDFKMEMKLWDELDKAGLMALYRGNKTEATTSPKIN
ncbi:alpha-N-acetylgalactosaminide alpha-2,6-sialyltransferase 2-like isoform X1 [Branchiostoma floridae x Branchiostoma belcheri]